MKKMIEKQYTPCIPTPEDVKEMRSAARLTQKKAAAVLYHKLSSWQHYEQNDRKMPPALRELFLLKTKLISLEDVEIAALNNESH
jgi:DNA-binding transcriptional regulator YiaG